LQEACKAADSGALVTFGIKPDKPETGYGYIQVDHVNDSGAVSVQAFVEKPDAETAQAYLDSGTYYWNSGMFVFRASAFLEALETHAPEIVSSCRAALNSTDRDGDFIRPDADSFSACPSDSIDYAVMEKADNAMMVPLKSDWDDIGSWSSLWSVMDKDSKGNASLGEVISLDCENSLFDSSGRLIAALGLSDVVVVDSGNAVLVADKSRVQQVKDIVQILENEHKTEFLESGKVHRPWGTYQSIHNGTNHQVKHITVAPGSSLSLQLHHHRSEHWVVVSGTAVVQVGEMEKVLKPNESVYIPVETKHRLTNRSDEILHLIVVQCGDYLGEDDIVRFDDVYGRAGSK
jgi:mannose-1-phosphate guanylyltransferase/mannose-6-phosphate isomerase